MISVLFLIYLIIANYTWYTIGMEKTRNSVIRRYNRHLDLLISDSDEGSEYVEKTKNEIKLNQRLMMTTSLLTLMGIIILGKLIIFFYLTSLLDSDFSKWLVFAIIASLVIATSGYTKGCENYIVRHKDTNYICELKHIKNVIIIRILSDILSVIGIIVFLICFFSN